MAHWRIGAPDVARACFARVDAIMVDYERTTLEKWKRGIQTHPSASMMRMFRVEAKTLLDGPPTEAAPAPRVVPPVAEGKT